ncbi:oxygen-dependent choline dehydrogenase-like [Centruroides vittatus]|uniref:oxygen-dependent choline dehydrogenase-like n=1 Tax=Centruroides vittatus TaxID=120091 RepID=UPI00350F4D56
MLEAGELPPLISQVPLFPQNLALTQGLKNWQHRVVAGKALGGSTALNFNLFVRENKRDYDNWAKNGATDWNWDNVFPYFLKVEDNRDYHIAITVLVEMSLQTPPFHAPVTEGFLKATKEIRYGIGDFNAEPQTVFQPQQGTINRGARWGALQAYINFVRGRRNLWILTSALVHKITHHILIDNKNAYGVKFEHRGQTYEAYAKHEVIVSAGVFNSPKLLMLSGIGPKHILEKFNDPDLPDIELLWFSLSVASDNGSVFRYLGNQKDVRLSVMEIWIGCEHYKRFSDEYLACLAIVLPFSVYHYCGTCKMGSDDDPTTVIDPTLKNLIVIYVFFGVKDVKGLRVADASIMPFVVTGHLNIPTYMIGEKAADMILYDLLQKHKQK